MVYFVNKLLLTLKFIFVAPVIFKDDDVEPILLLILFISLFILFIFVLIFPKDDNIFVPETVNDDITEILSDVILLHVCKIKISLQCL